MDRKTLIFDIKRYAIHDGPGIRTTVFIKGCPLRCVWCHNPESWSPLPQRLYKQNKCIGCSSCISICPQHGLHLTPEGIQSTGEQCLHCGKCAEECPAVAMEICGKEWSIEDLLSEILREKEVMNNGGGGVTISGGEPLMHPEFTLSLLKAIGREGIHRAVDTTLFASPHTVIDVARECELFLIDLKSMDSEVHKKFTGVSNEVILQNLNLIASLDHPYYIRIPLISGVNSSESNIRATARFLSQLDRKPEVVDLLPYHDIGKGKHERMGSIYNPTDYQMSAPTKEETEIATSILSSFSLTPRIGG